MSGPEIVTCPRCGCRMRLRAGTLPDRFRVRCGGCGQPFLVEAAAASGATRRLRETEIRAGSHPSVTVQGTAPAHGRTRPDSRVAAPAPGGLAFAAGEMVAGRYRVVRFLAQGGMGEVYEAEDTALGASVALKTVRPDVAADPKALARFRREVQVARQVTHRHVCRIHDLGVHRSEQPVAALYPGHEIPFVSMELLRGETLARKLARDGRMSEAEALPLVEQLAGGLDAAHAAGIAHRDFKTANVVLETGSDGRLRAVITDFGLARPAADDASGALTVAGTVLGSPAYMSPEQVEGKPAGPPGDVYAFGVVLYEIVTGSLPFQGDTAIGTAVKRLSEAPPRPRELRPDLDPQWEGAILSCLALRPEERFPSAGEAVAALRPGATPVATPSVPAAIPVTSPRRARRRLALGVLAAVLLTVAVAVNVVSWRGWAERREGGFAAPSRVRPAVAVLPLQDVSGDPETAWLATGLPQMLSSELGVDGAVRIVPGENVARARRELGLKDGEEGTEALLPRLRQNLGADFVVTGSYASLPAAEGRRIRLDLRLLATDTRENAHAVAVQGSAGELFDLVSAAGARLRDALEVTAVRSSERPFRMASPQAARLHVEGVDRLNAFDAQGALPLFRQAAEVDPRNPRIHASLATAWAALGYNEKSRAEAKLALDLSAPLGPAERDEIRGLYLQTTGRWEEAAALWDGLWRTYPDNLEYGLELARALVASGRAGEALAVTEALERLPAAAAGDVRIRFAEAVAAGALGQFPRQESAAAEAERMAGEQGSGLLRAEALLLRGGALRNLGRPRPALEATRTAETLFRDGGDLAGEAKARLQLASLLYDQGELDAAREIFAQAAETYGRLGDKGNEAQALNNLAVVLKQQGQTDRALELYRLALDLSEETGNAVGIANAQLNIGGIELQRGELGAAAQTFGQARDLARAAGDRSQEAYALFNLAVALRKLGRLDEAEARQQEALAAREEMGQRGSEAASLCDLGAIAWERGRLTEARRLYERALAISRETGNRRFEAFARFGLGQTALSAGDLAGAGEHHAAALELRRQLGEGATEAESRLALGEIDLAEGRHAEAAVRLRDAATALASLGSHDLEARARALEARALLALGDVGAAGEAVREARERTAATEHVRTRVEVLLAAARVASVADAPAGRALADEARLLAEGAGLRPLDLEASLLALRADPGAGDPAEVAAAASRLGLGLLEREARSGG